MHPYNPLSFDELCIRWHRATVANSLLQWRALSHLLEAEAMMCVANDLTVPGDGLAALSRLAHRHALDLQPQPELEPA